MAAEPAPIRIVAAEPRHAAEWADARRALWPDEPAAELRAEADAYFAGRAKHLEQVLVALDGEGRVIGFAELNLRPYAEGCTSDRIAYLEGWYVGEAHRRRGVGAALVAAAERWAVAIGCSELASDALHDNEASRRAHLALGFDEVETIRCFRKQLDAGAKGAKR